MNKIKKFFDREQNLLIHFISSIIVTIMGLKFSLCLTEWLLIYFAIAFVITSELINSSIELTVDLYTKEFNPLAMVAKDVSAGAVLTAAITAFAIGIYVFIPKLIYLIK